MIFFASRLSAFEHGHPFIVDTHVRKVSTEKIFSDNNKKNQKYRINILKYRIIIVYLHQSSLKKYESTKQIQSH